MIEINQANLFEEMEKHLLFDEKPSEYFAHLDDMKQLNAYPFDMLEKLKHTEQSKIHHPEGNVWNHTMLVVDEASKEKEKSTDKRVFMWAALLHDIGKPETTKKKGEKITAYDHDKKGAVRAREFLEHLCNDEDFITKVEGLVRWHMQILFVAKDMPFSDVQSMNKQTSVYEIALLGLCDRLGRTHPNKKKEMENVDLFIKKCSDKINKYKE